VYLGKRGKGGEIVKKKGEKKALRQHFCFFQHATGSWCKERWFTSGNSQLWWGGKEGNKG